MSLILEALKKSEQQRRLGEAPTLGTPVLATRRSRSVWPLLGVLIAAALAAGWWLARPSTSPVPAARDAATAGSTRGRVAPPPAPTPHANRARPVEHAAAPAAKPAAPRAPGGRDAAVILPAPAAGGERPGSAARLAPALPAVAGPKPGVAATKPARAPVPPNAADHAPTPTPAAAAAQPQPQRGPVLPTVWDLPYATRKDLPDLTLTMHVYAPDPHERFVVIKGDRHVEGDDLGDGVTLREIRADGMLLEFKGKRFLYPRDGR